MSKYMEFEKLRDFGGIISDSITFFIGHFKSLLRPLLLIGGIFLLALMVTFVVQQLKVYQLFSFGKSPLPGRQIQPMEAMFSMEYGMFIFFSFFCYCTFSLVTLAYMALYRDSGGQRPSMEELWDFYKQRALGFYGSGFLILLLLLVATVFFVIPGIYLMPVLGLVFPVMVFERAGFGEALGRAFKLIRHHWWATFGVLLVTGIVVGVALGIVSLPATALLIAAPYIGNFSNLRVIAAVYSALVQPLVYLLYTLPIVVTAICYFSYREEKDGTGLLKRMESFGKADTFAANDGLEQY